MLHRPHSKRMRPSATPPTARRSTDPHATSRLVDTYLARLGRSCTSQRRAILEVLVTVGGHMTVPVLHALASEKSPGISYSTVYRTLAQLSSSGIVRNHEFGDGGASYELASDSEHHDHLICVVCSAVLEFSIPEMPILQRKIAVEYGFELTHQRHVLYGVCPECRQRRGRERSATSA